jgi:hypothetical protein
MSEWRCPCCGVANEGAEVDCRVCRAARPGLQLPAPTLDPPPSALLRSLPAPVLLAVLATVLFTHWEPITRPLAATKVHSGWSQEQNRDRNVELRRALGTLVGLFNELNDSVEGRAPLAGEWSQRLSTVRLDFQLFGEQEWSPGFGDVEAALNDVVLAMASIRYEMASGVDPAQAKRRLADARRLLNTAERRLQDAR